MVQYTSGLSWYQSSAASHDEVGTRQNLFFMALLYNQYVPINAHTNKLMMRKLHILQNESIYLLKATFFPKYNPPKLRNSKMS